MKGEPLEILLVEDNEDHAELVRRALAGHRVANRLRHLQGAQAALDSLFRRGAFADPAASPRPHVVLTTSDAECDLARAYGSHANSHLVKPLGFESFQQLMADFGFSCLGWNTCPEA